MKCKKCGSEQVILLSKKVISLKSAMQRVYGNTRHEPEFTDRFRCGKCGNIFESENEDLIE